MAGRPTIKRTTRSYDRDIESLNRLRMSLVVHETTERGQQVIETIDRLVYQLVILRRTDVKETG